MKKGFTLIELLAVITLIGVISIIGSISVTKLIERSKEKTYEEQIHNIELAAKTWATNNTNLLLEYENFKTYVNVEDLKLAGLLENKQIIDPRDKSELNGCVSITYNSKNKKYKYQYTNDCTDKSNYPTINITYLNNENKYIEVEQSNTPLDLATAIFVDAWDSEGNAFTSTDKNRQLIGPTITKNGEEVTSIIPNHVGDEFILTYKAVVVDKNIISIKSIKLKVVDTTPPDIIYQAYLKNDIIDYVEIKINDTYNYPDLNVVDNSGEDIKITRTGKVNTEKDGTYKLVYTAVDSSKNKSTYTINVTVEKEGTLMFDLIPSEPDGNDNWYKTPANVTVSNIKYNDNNLTIGTDVNCTYQVGDLAAESLTANSFTTDYNGKAVNVKVKCALTSNPQVSKEKKIALNIDTVPPTCTTTGGSSSWKNSNVTITGRCTDLDSGCVKSSVSFTTNVLSGGEVNRTDIGPGRNGKTETIYDNAGHSTVCEANQTVKIDRIAPTCTVTATNADGTTHSDWTNQEVTVTGTCSDTGGSGCVKDSISETYNTTWNSKAYPALLESNYTLKDNAGNKVVCGGKTVKIDITEPYPPYICGIKAIQNISSIDYSCKCESLQLIGGGGTVERCNGKVICDIKIDPTMIGKPFLYSTSFCGIDVGSGVDKLVYSEYATNWQPVTQNFRVLAEPRCDNWSSTTLIYFGAYDKVGNTNEASHYLVVYHYNLDVVPGETCYLPLKIQS